MADLVAPEARVAAFSVYRMMINIGFACGLALGGILAGESYHLLFIGDAVTSTLFALIAITALPHGTRTTKREERERDRASAGRSILADKGFLLVMGAVFVDRGDLHAERDDVRAARDRPGLLDDACTASCSP